MMINTMKSSNLLTRTGLLTVLGVVALSNPAFANMEEGNILDINAPEQSLLMSTTEMKEEKNESNNIEQISEVESSTSGELEPNNELNEELEEDTTEESHSDASGGSLWKNLNKWFSEQMKG
ncbi:MAG: hypothetical protein MRY79_03835 [Alphaproteobacteria bacterium]|nr:hypothetical protein [Alphaproteobacteria bacterium]